MHMHTAQDALKVAKDVFLATYDFGDRNLDFGLNANLMRELGYKGTLSLRQMSYTPENRLRMGLIFSEGEPLGLTLLDSYNDCDGRTVLRTDEREAVQGRCHEGNCDLGIYAITWIPGGQDCGSVYMASRFQKSTVEFINGMLLCPDGSLKKISSYRRTSETPECMVDSGMALDWTGRDMSAKRFIELMDTQDLSVVGDSSKRQQEMCFAMSSILKGYFNGRPGKPLHE
ncbi:MAG: hypothetical protein V1648_00900 [Candidatus Aenigmatarchaeota archaeon]